MSLTVDEREPRHAYDGLPSSTPRGAPLSNAPEQQDMQLQSLLWLNNYVELEFLKHSLDGCASVELGWLQRSLGWELMAVGHSSYRLGVLQTPVYSEKVTARTPKSVSFEERISAERVVLVYCLENGLFAG
jgi:hypothetical protein